MASESPDDRDTQRRMPRSAATKAAEAATAAARAAVEAAEDWSPPTITNIAFAVHRCPGVAQGMVGIADTSPAGKLQGDPFR